MGICATSTRRLRAFVVACVVLVVVALPSAAGAHFLDSSAISIRIGETESSATISLSVWPLSQALGDDYPSNDDFDRYAAVVIDYLDEHLTVVGADGRPWAETYHSPVRGTVDGHQAFSVDVTFDSAGADPADFSITYDAIIESVAGHETVVVVRGLDGAISNPGILDAGRTSLAIGEGAGTVAFADMVEYGFEHVLEGADHLLFLTTLLLPAPLIVAGRRWERGPSPTATVRKVVHVITAFTVGHSLTLAVSALGWVAVPSRPVEVLIAASVGVSAVHAMRPLTARGELIIAVVFGLVHGLAFAGILADLGLSGSTSVVTLLAFNLGIELSQLVTAALVFPSLWLLSTTRWYPAVRLGGAAVALTAAIGWGLERIEVIDNPLGPLEDAAIHHPWRIVLGLLAIAAAATTAERIVRSAGADQQRGEATPAPPRLADTEVWLSSTSAIGARASR